MLCPRCWTWADAATREAAAKLLWRGRWEAFTDYENEERFDLELEKELRDNPAHVLRGKEARYIGSRVRNLGWNDFILYLPFERQYAYVHLTWSRETNALWPYTELLGDAEAAQKFIDEWDEP